MTSTPLAPSRPSRPSTRRPERRVLGLLAVVGVVALLAVASVLIGSRDVGIADVVAALSGSAEGFDQAAVAKRIPRTLLAIVAGAALAVSGAVMQGVTRNPLADPGVLGINTGASLAVVSGIAFFGLTSAVSYIWVAIGGAAVTAVFVYLIGSLGRGGATPLKLALAGAATAAALASFVTAVVLVRGDVGDSVRSWQVGGVGGGSYASLEQVGPFILVGLAICFISARGLNSLALGDDLAAGLGERVALTRAAGFLGSVVLAGSITAVTGPIGFVGLVVPLACRLLAGVDHRWLIPFSAAAGAGLLVAADVLGRIVARPTEVDVGIITALIGAPFFIWIVRRRKMREL